MEFPAAGDLKRGWDTHCHIFDPVNHPYVDNAPYTPSPRSVQDLVTTSQAGNNVIVMSVPEGTDPALTLESVAALIAMGRGARGTIVMEPTKMNPFILADLHKSGIRSVRLHQGRVGEDIKALKKLITDTAHGIHLAGLRWPIDAQFNFNTWVALLDHLAETHQKYGTTFVADHLFSCSPTDAAHPSFEDLQKPLAQGILNVKVSGMGRDKGQRSVEDFEPLITACMRMSRGDGVIFGSDWPHVQGTKGSSGFNEVDISAHIRFLYDVCTRTGEGFWEKLWWKNAERLYQ